MKLQLNNLITKEVFSQYKDKVTAINHMIDAKTGLGNDYLGWADWPFNYDKIGRAHV